MVVDSRKPKHNIFLIGGSAGSTTCIQMILTEIPESFPLPILIVQHLHESDNNAFADHLALSSRLKIVVPQDKCPVERGNVYVAPAGYHILLENDITIALSKDAKVNYSRPSIDVLFESAAYALGPGVIALLLSGAGKDGALGLKTIQAAGGTTMTQEPETAEFPMMPQAAIEIMQPDYIKPLPEIIGLLRQIVIEGR